MVTLVVYIYIFYNYYYSVVMHVMTIYLYGGGSHIIIL